jgi:hypothetical protein
MSLLVSRECETRNAVTPGEAVDVIEAALARGRARLPSANSLAFPEEHGDVHAKGPTSKEPPHLVFKIALPGFATIPSRDCPQGAA